MPTTCVTIQTQKPQTALPRLFASATLSMAVLLGLASTAKAEIIVSLQQVDENGTPISSVLANPNPAQQTLTYADLVVSGSGSPLPLTDLYGFATVLTWSTNVPGVTTADLYTVNSSGSPTESATSMLVNESGFLFDDPEDIASAEALMNTTNLDQTSQRYVFVENFNFNPTLNDPVGSITIARIRLAVALGVTEAIFSFDLDGTGAQLGFSDLGANLYEFQSGGGSIVVVPEPSPLPGCLVGFLVLGGWATILSRRRSSMTPITPTTA